MIKKADIILAICLIIVGCAASYFLTFHSQSGSEVEIWADGTRYGTYDLFQDQIVYVEQNDHINHIAIQDGYVHMEYSDCLNQECVHQGSISNSAQVIVCLPNRVIVNILGQDSPYDAVTY